MDYAIENVKPINVSKVGKFFNKIPYFIRFYSNERKC